MKNETNSSVVETASKQIWTEPTLTNLSVSLHTHGNPGMGGDGGGMTTSNLT